MPEERRQHHRNPVNFRARIGGRGHGVSAAVIRDVSLGGVYAETKLELSVGNDVILQMEVVALEVDNILVERKIRRVDARNSVFGYGVQFIRISDEDIVHLCTYLAVHFGSGAEKS
jgi:hypothetical protein